MSQPLPIRFQEHLQVSKNRPTSKSFLPTPIWFSCPKSISLRKSKINWCIYCIWSNFDGKILNLFSSNSKTQLASTIPATSSSSSFRFSRFHHHRTHHCTKTTAMTVNDWTHIHSLSLLLCSSHTNLLNHFYFLPPKKVIKTSIFHWQAQFFSVKIIKNFIIFFSFYINVWLRFEEEKNRSIPLSKKYK